MTRVLIVDDNEQNLYLLQVLLQGQGYEVRSARNGIDALDLARREPPDLIITDILMPGMDGFSLCREWTTDETLQHVPLVFCTATYTDPKDETFALNLGAARFIVKPIEPDAFVEILRQVLENHAAQRLPTPDRPSQAAEVYYQQYNQALIRKLEDKMAQLEEANHALELDIATRKQTEEALRESEKRFRLISTVASDYMFSSQLDADGRLTLNWVAGAFEEITGYTFDEYIAHGGWRASLHPDDLAVDDRDLERLRSNRPIITEVRTLTKGDDVVWVRVYAHPIWDAARQELVGIYGAVQNVTERKQAEEALQRRASQLALLNEIGGQVVALLDLDEVLSQAAQLIQERFGFHHVGLFTKADGQGRLVMSARAGEFAYLFPPGYAVALGQGMVGWVGLHGKTLLANDVATEPHYVNPYPDRLPTRSELSVPIQIGDEIVGVLDLQSPQPNDFGSDSVTTLETLADQMAVAIHNARLYSQAAQRNRELSLLNRVIAATAAAGDAIEPILEIVCRELALAFDVPHAAAALFNKEKTEVVVVAEYRAEGRPSGLGEVIPVAGNPAIAHLLAHKTPLAVDESQTDPYLAPLLDLMRQRGTASLLLLPLRVDGKVVGSLGVDAIDPRPFSAAEVDLAWRVAEQVSSVLARARLKEEHRKIEEQFLQAQKLEAVGRLAGGVAHDFNNLLTVIQLSTRLLGSTLHPQDPIREHVRSIEEAGQRAANLTRQLLVFSRREVAEPHLLDLNEVVSNLDKMLRRIIGEDIQLRTALARDLWPIRIDPTHIDQVILNLVVNARDAMPMGGSLTIETARVVLDRAYAARHLDVEPGEYVMLAVSDTGVGMDENVQAHLFEPFFTTKEKDKGTGLGLATVHGIVKQNGGHIWVCSEPGQGTTFKIYLPHVAKGSRTPSGLPTEGARLARGSETLLLVEDEPGVRKLTRDILVAQGYGVLTARDGVEALQIASEHQGPIHLLITDVVMPRLGGRALANQLRSRRPELRVLYTSGYTDDAIVHHGVLEAGIAFLPKPLTGDRLLRKVRDVLDSSI
jgi:two-component system cell cycle sensor histidine kinase/response regulator CckA